MVKANDKGLMIDIKRIELSDEEHDRIMSIINKSCTRDDSAKEGKVKEILDLFNKDKVFNINPGLSVDTIALAYIIMLRIVARELSLPEGKMVDVLAKVNNEILAVYSEDL